MASARQPPEPRSSGYQPGSGCGVLTASTPFGVPAGRVAYFRVASRSQIARFCRSRRFLHRVRFPAAPPRRGQGYRPWPVLTRASSPSTDRTLGLMVFDGFHPGGHQIHGQRAGLQRPVAHPGDVQGLVPRRRASRDSRSPRPRGERGETKPASAQATDNMLPITERPPPAWATKSSSRRSATVRLFRLASRWPAGKAATVSSISRHLRDAGHITPAPQKRPKSSYIRFATEHPNERRQATSPSSGWPITPTPRSSAGSTTTPATRSASPRIAASPVRSSWRRSANPTASTASRRQTLGRGAGQGSTNRST